jgi:hypothetical protein
MSDWIKARVGLAQQKEHAETLRLHKASVAAVQIPILWKAIHKHLESELQRYYEHVPTDRSSVVVRSEENGRKLRIKRETAPLNELVLEEHGNILSFSVSKRHSIWEENEPEHGHLECSIGRDDKLSVTCEDRVFTSAFDIAGFLLDKIVPSG